MHIRDTRKCNLWNLQKVAAFLGADPHVIRSYYEELINDSAFLAGLNQSIRMAREHGFQKGIFRKPRVASVDWFAFERVLLYVLVRHLKPAHCLETGVFYGGNTAFILAALARNGCGQLISIDYPDTAIRRDGTFKRHTDVGESEFYDQPLGPGFLVPASLHPYWKLMLGDSLTIIPSLEVSFSLYIHDSEHSYDFMLRELSAALERSTPEAVLIADDIDWSNAFYTFCSCNAFFPLLLTDNGKDDLRVRTGVVKRDHPKNHRPDIVGRKERHGDQC